jgi:hypothetical protein
MDCNNLDWQINTGNDTSDLLFKYSDVIDIQCRLDTTKTEYSIVEKFVYDIAHFHLKQLNMDFDENTIVTFWTNKKTPNCSVNFHLDRDDYEDRVYNTTTNIPFLTTITYLNDSNYPTMFTNIDSYANEKYMDNSKICLSFPRKMKHTRFNGKYIHSGINIYGCNPDDNTRRNLILVALWKKPPLHVPFYDDSIFSYLNFMYNNVIITNKKYNKNEELMQFYEKDEMQTVIIDNNIITQKFFENIIDKSTIYQLHGFSKIFDYIFKHLYCKSDTFIIDEVSNIQKYEKYINCMESEINKNANFIKQYTYPFMIRDSNNSVCSSLLKCDLKTWSISSSNNIHEQNTHIQCLINECILSNKYAAVYLLNHNKNEFNLIEKYVYDIIKFHLNRMNIRFDTNIVGGFSFKSRKIYGLTTTSGDLSVNNKKLSKKPFLSCLTYFDNNNDPTIITNIDNDSYKFKNLTDNTLCFSFPTRMKHIVFNGGKYYHCEGNVFDNSEQDERCILVIDIWYNHIPVNLEYYDSKKHSNYTARDIFKRDDYILHFNNENQNIKKIEVTDDILNSNIFEEILYKKDAQVFNKFKNIFNKQDLYNNNTIILYKNNKSVKCNNPHQVSSMKFDTELFTKNDNVQISNENLCKFDSNIKRHDSLEPPIINKDDVQNSVLNVSNPIKLNNSFNLNRHIVEKFLDFHTCGFIIQEITDYIYKKNEWNIIYMNNEKISIIDIDKLPKTLNYIINNIFDLYSKSIKDNFLFLKEKKINFKEIFVTKYCDFSNSFNFYNSTTTITSYIFLNNTNLLVGSGKNINKDDDIIVANEGNMLMHISDSDSNIIKHISDDGYFIVFYIELYD